MPLEVISDSFTIERMLAKQPAEVFSAWSDPGKKARWFAAPDREESGYSCDFRVGGNEYAAFSNEAGLHENYTRYFQIVPGELIVFAYSMAMNGHVHSVSLVSVRFEEATGGTRLTYSEQMCVMGESDGAAGREHGWTVLLDRMAEMLDADALERA